MSRGTVFPVFSAGFTPVAACLAIAAALVSGAPAPAHAFDLFQSLFGGPQFGPQVRAYANPGLPPGVDGPPPATRRSGGGGGSAYCVRLCDGRFFPVSQRRDASAVELCNSFCPSAKTKVFSGSLIDHAVSRDGERYADLPNAFAFRDRLVADCTCNGKTSGGLSAVSIKDDPTLRNGDVVATQEGFKAVASARNDDVQLAPASGAASPRGRVGALKIAPAASDLEAEPASEDSDLGGLRVSAQHD